MKNRFFIKTQDLLFYRKFQMLFTELLFFIVASYLSLPIVIKGFYLVIKGSPFSAITKENFFKVLGTSGAILYIFVVLLLVMLLLLLNITMILVLLDSRCRKSRKNLWEYLVQVEKHYANFLFSSKISRIGYMLPFGIAIYFPPLILLVYNNSVLHYFVSYITKGIGNRNFWLLFIGIYLVSLCILVWRFPYIRYLILDDVLPKSAARRSRVGFVQYMKKAGTQLVWGLALLAGSAVIYIIFIFIGIFFVNLTTKNGNTLAKFYDVYDNINIAVAVISVILCGVCNLASITVMSGGYISNHFVEKINIRTKKDIFKAVVFGIFSCIAIYISVDIIFGADVSVYSIIQKTQISAHRGASTEAPENTIPAIEKAIENGADYVEIDVRLTADGQVVLMHDATTTRTTNGSMVISNSTYAELQALDAGAWFSEEYVGTKIPTLEEAIEACKGKIMMNIELKSSGTAGELEEKVAELITDYHMEDQCIVTSFQQKSLLAIKAYNPDILTGYIFSFGYSNKIDYEAMDILSIDSNYLSKSIVTGAHEKGIIVHAWTVNDGREIRRMLAIGVDNIITDNPILAQRTLYNKNNHTFMDIWKYIASLYTM